MSVVLTDPEIDRAEAFRLAKLFPLPESVVIGSSSELLSLESYCSVYGISDLDIVRRIVSRKLMISLSGYFERSGLEHADRLSHIVDSEAPCRFVDLRSVLAPSTAQEGDIPSEEPSGDEPPG